MIVGIVGSEAAKFTDKGLVRAMTLLTSIISDSEVTEVVSGKCHLGGIDIWAVQVAQSLRIPFKEFPPRRLSWPYYKERNLQIVERSDIVHCITVDQLPIDFMGMKFNFCYHCNSSGHIKSGGCWTMKQAIALGKKGELHIVKNL